MTAFTSSCRTNRRSKQALSGQSGQYRFADRAHTLKSSDLWESQSDLKAEGYSASYVDQIIGSAKAMIVRWQAAGGYPGGTPGRLQKMPGSPTAGGSVFHDLRHTFVTNMRRSGVHDTVIMQITGHYTLSDFAGIANSVTRLFHGVAGCSRELSFQIAQHLPDCVTPGENS